MSRNIHLADDAIRSALTVDAEVRAPAGLAAAIRARTDATPQVGSPWHLMPVSPRTRVALRLGVTVALLAALLIVGAQREQSAAISTYGGGPTRDHVMPGPGPDGVPILEWESTIGPMGPWSPLVADGIVYNADARGVVKALEATTGRTIWEAPIDVPASSGVSLDDGVLLVGDVDGILHMLDATDGSERGTYDIGSPMSGPPAVADGVAYFGTIDGYLHAIEIETATPAWTQPVRTSGQVGRAVAVADGLVFAGSAGATPEAPGRLAAYETGDGGLRWSRPLGPGIPSTPTVGAGLALITDSIDGFGDTFLLHAFDVFTSEPAWSAPFASPTGAAMHIVAVADGRAFAAAKDGHLYAVDLGDGTLDWTAPTSPGMALNGAYADGTVYVTGAGSDVIAFDAGGEERWKVNLEQGSARSPAIVDGRIIVATDAGWMVSLADPADR